MATKFVISALAVIGMAAGLKRESGSGGAPGGFDYNQYLEYINKFGGQSGFGGGNFPTPPAGFDKFPAIPGSGSASEGTPSKRESGSGSAPGGFDYNQYLEYINKFGGQSGFGGGNFPTPPAGFDKFPAIPGSGSASEGTPSKRESGSGSTPGGFDYNQYLEYINKFGGQSGFGGGNFPTPPAGFDKFPAIPGSGSTSEGNPSKRESGSGSGSAPGGFDYNQYLEYINKFGGQSGLGGGNFPTPPAGFDKFPAIPGSGSESS